MSQCQEAAWPKRRRGPVRSSAVGSALPHKKGESRGLLELPRSLPFLLPGLFLKSETLPDLGNNPFFTCTSLRGFHFLEQVAKCLEATVAARDENKTNPNNESNWQRGETDNVKDKFS